MDLSSLPFEVIAAILSHVPLKERLSTCALVCSTWAAASAGASTALSVHLRSQAQADNLAAWLAQHGTTLECLSVCSDQAAYQESLLQWQLRRKQGPRSDGDVVVNEPDLVNYELPPRPACFMLHLPWRQLHGLRRLHVDHLRLRAAATPATTPAAAAGPAAEPGSTANPRSTDGAGNTTVTAAGAPPPPTASVSASADSAQLQHTAAPHLTHLHIDSSFIYLPGSLRGTHGFFSSLQALKVTQDPDDTYAAFLWTKDATAAFLKLSVQCSCLQRLLLSTALLVPAGLQRLTGMAHLQHVELHVPRGTWRRPVAVAPWLQHLPAQQLTHLKLWPVVQGEAEKTLDLACTSVGRLSTFTRLQHLDMAHGANFDPSVLGPLSALTFLQLNDIDLAKGGSTQPHGSAAMLSALACLQQLQVLQLSPGLLPQPHAPVEQYSALTASSHLTFFSLYHCILPPGAAAAMFPASRRGALQGLRALRVPQPPAGHRACSADILNTRSPFLSGPAASILRAARDGGAASSSSCNGLPFGRGSLEGLVGCCPNLSQLWLTAAVAADADLASLRALTALTELQLGGSVVDDGAAAQLLCGLTQLRRLDLLQCPRLTDAGLVYLTALRELTSLQVSGGLSHCTGGVQNLLYMCRRQEGSVSSTPVWERLQQQCLNSRDCLLVMLQQRDQQLAAAEARAAAAEARVAAAEARTAAAAEACTAAAAAAEARTAAAAAAEARTAAAAAAEARTAAAAAAEARTAAAAVEA